MRMRCSDRSLYGIVLQLALQISDQPRLDLDRLVHVQPVPSRVAPVVEPQLVVGIHVGRAHPSPEIERHARHPVSAHRRLGSKQRADLVARARPARARRRRAKKSSRASPGWRRDSSDRRSPFHGRTYTRSVNWRAIATVSSVLSASTTMISSAQERDVSASAIASASFFVMTMAETGGTAAASYTTRSIWNKTKRWSCIAGPARISRGISAFRRGCTAPATCSRRSCCSIRRMRRRSEPASPRTSKQLRARRWCCRRRWAASSSATKSRARSACARSSPSAPAERR